MKIRHIFISPGHNFFGHHGKPAGENQIAEVESVECVAGRGIVGDRFLDHAENYKGQITLFSLETFEAMKREFGAPDMAPSAMRRNIIVEDADLPTLVGKRFALQGVELEGVEECKPCHWMDGAIAPGAEAWMRGRGGLRCRIVAGGTLRRDA
ncbi:MAG TPA: MOSC domain-containing protein [Opitutaceae bacterium]|nr:MOSC domain-containing protein [Opitutaceae bacterium]